MKLVLVFYFFFGMVLPGVIRQLISGEFVANIKKSDSMFLILMGLLCVIMFALPPIGYRIAKKREATFLSFSPTGWILGPSLATITGLILAFWFKI